MSELTICFEAITKINLDEQSIKNWLQSVCRKENKSLISISLVLCSDDYLLAINKEHLNHDYYTDIITFDLSEDDDEIEGELYISVDRVKENASDLHVSFNNELHRVIVHGVLHLIGYGDKSTTEQELMRAKENAYLSLLD